MREDCRTGIALWRHKKTMSYDFKRIWVRRWYFTGARPYPSSWPSRGDRP